MPCIKDPVPLGDLEPDPVSGYALCVGDEVESVQDVPVAGIVISVVLDEAGSYVLLTNGQTYGKGRTLTQLPMTMKFRIKHDIIKDLKKRGQNVSTLIPIVAYSQRKAGLV